MWSVIQNSLSLLVNRNSLLPKDIPTNLSDVLHAERPGRAPSAVMDPTGVIVKCTQQYVPNAARTLRFPSNLVETGLFIAVTASVVRGRLVNEASKGVNQKKRPLFRGLFFFTI